MAIGGPYVKFHSKNLTVKVACYGYESGSIEDVYERAKPYLLQWKEELISQHGYSDQLPPPFTNSSPLQLPLLFPTLCINEDNALLMSLSASADPASASDSSSTYTQLFMLPKSAQAFASSSSQWEPVFSSLRVSRESGDLLLDEVLPLQNIFYLLQIIFDGMLSLVMRADETQTTHRVMPRKEWIQQNNGILKDVLGLSSTTEVEEDAECFGFFVDYKRKDNVDDYGRGLDVDSDYEYDGRRAWYYDPYDSCESCDYGRVLRHAVLTIVVTVANALTS